MARRTPTPRYGLIKGLGAFGVPISTPNSVPAAIETVGLFAFMLWQVHGGSSAKTGARRERRPQGWRSCAAGPG